MFKRDISVNLLKGKGKLMLTIVVLFIPISYTEGIHPCNGEQSLQILTVLNVCI